MKSLELQPTLENLIDTYKENAIGRNDYLHRFVDLLNSIEDNCVIAVDNQWGSGKTFFVKQAKLILDSFNDFTSVTDEKSKAVVSSYYTRFTHKDKDAFQPHVTAYFDAWEYDNEEDPLLSLVYEIFKTVANEYSFDIGKNLEDVLVSISDLLAQKSVSQVINVFRKNNSTFAATSQSRDLRQEINDFFASLLEEKGQRLVIFIDELDRCKPSYAVKLLERIKHYFNNENITFVLSVNSVELQKTIKHFYGNEFDACRYLDRFFDLRTSLPAPDLTKFYSLIDFSNRYYYDDVIADAMIRKYNFSLREITRYVKLLKIAGYKLTHGSGIQTSKLGNNVIPVLSMQAILIGLKMHDTKAYYAFVNGQSVDLCIEMMTQNEIYDRLAQLFDIRGVYDQNDIFNTYKEKIKLLYETIFVTQYQKYDEPVDVGRFKISEYTKKCIFEAMSLLAEFSQYEEPAQQN